MMTPIFLNPPNTQYFNLNQEHQEDQQQQQQQQQLIVTSSPFCQPIGNNNSSTSSNLHLDQGVLMMRSNNHSMTDQSHAFNDQLEGSKNVFFDGESLSYGAQVINSTDTYGSHQNHDLFIFKQQEDQEQNNLNGGGGGLSTDNNGSSLRWMSSKIRMMRKMINSNGPKTDPRGGSRIISSSNSSDQTAPNNNNNNVIRTCSDCNTTRTPLWRSGPQGPKSLCNACGIRQRKARKAAMEAAAAAAATNTSCTEDSSSTTTKTTIKLMIKKDKKKSRGSNTCVSQHSNKKKTPCKEQANQLPDSDHSNTSSISKQQLRFEEFAVDLLSKNAAFHRMFPRDEEEGALLLMALSYGLIQS